MVLPRPIRAPSAASAETSMPAAGDASAAPSSPGPDEPPRAAPLSPVATTPSPAQPEAASPASPERHAAGQRAVAPESP